MSGRSSPRPLSRSLDPIAGESLSGYLLRLSWRLHVSPLRLARLTGCVSDGPAVIRRTILLDLDVQRFAQATQLTASEASSLTIASWADRYPPIRRSRIGPERRTALDGWLFSASVRYCPDCLIGDGTPVQQEYGGPWKKIWHLPVSFACLQHRRFLQEGCAQAHPGAPAAWRLIPFPSASALHPAQCRFPLLTGETGRPRSSCGIRLDQAIRGGGMPQPSPEVLNAQKRLLDLLSPQEPAEEAACAFTDLRVISALLCRSWPLGQDLVESCMAAAVSEHVHRLGTGHPQSLERQPGTILAIAGLLTAAMAILNGPDLAATMTRHAQACHWGGPRGSSWARVFKRHDLTCSPALRQAAMPLIRSLAAIRGL